MDRLCVGSGRGNLVTTAIKDILEDPAKTPTVILKALAREMTGKAAKSEAEAWGLLKGLAANEDGALLPAADARKVKDRLEAAVSAALKKLNPAQGGQGEDPTAAPPKGAKAQGKQAQEGEPDGKAKEIKEMVKNTLTIRGIYEKSGMPRPPIKMFDSKPGEGGGGPSEDALLTSLAQRAYDGAWDSIKATPPRAGMRGTEALVFLQERLTSVKTPDPSPQELVAKWLGPARDFPGGILDDVKLPKPLPPDTYHALLGTLTGRVLEGLRRYDLVPYDDLLSGALGPLYTEVREISPAGVGLQPADGGASLTLEQAADTLARAAIVAATPPQTLQQGIMYALLAVEREYHAMTHKKPAAPQRSRQTAPPRAGGGGGGERGGEPLDEEEETPLGACGRQMVPRKAATEPTVLNHSEQPNWRGGRAEVNPTPESLEIQEIKYAAKKDKVRQELDRVMEEAAGHLGISFSRLPTIPRNQRREIEGCLGNVISFRQILCPSSTTTPVYDTWHYLTTPSKRYRERLYKVSEAGDAFSDFDPRARALAASLDAREAVRKASLLGSSEEQFSALQLATAALVGKAMDIEEWTQRHVPGGGGNPDGPDRGGAGLAGTVDFLRNTTAKLAAIITDTRIPGPMEGGALDKPTPTHLKVYGMSYAAAWGWLWLLAVEGGLVPLTASAGMVELIRSTTRGGPLDYFKPTGNPPAAPAPAEAPARAARPPEAPAAAKAEGGETATLLKALVSAIGKLGGDQDREGGGGRKAEGPRGNSRERNGEGVDNPLFPPLKAPTGAKAKAIPYALSRERHANELVSGGGSTHGPPKPCNYCGEKGCSKDHKSTHYALPPGLKPGNPMSVRACHEHVEAQLK